MPAMDNGKKREPKANKTRGQGMCLCRQEWGTGHALVPGCLMSPSLPALGGLEQSKNYCLPRPLPPKPLSHKVTNIRSAGTAAPECQSVFSIILFWSLSLVWLLLFDEQCVCVCAHMHMRACLHVCMPDCVCVCMRVCVCMCVCMRAFMRVPACVHVCVCSHRRVGQCTCVEVWL